MFFYISVIFLVLPSLDPDVIVVHCNVSLYQILSNVYLVYIYITFAAVCSELLNVVTWLIYSADSYYNLHWLLHVLWDNSREDVQSMVHIQSSNITQQVCKSMGNCVWYLKHKELQL